MKLHFAFICLLILGALTITEPLAAQSQNGWRGPYRNGLYPESELLKSWPTEGPDMLWETSDAGRGYSSPVIAGDRLYITGMNQGGDREIFSAYTLNGEKIYELEYGSPWDATYPETRTTPTIMDDRAWVISGEGEIVCIEIANGDILWHVEGGELFERETGRWGTAESPLVFDNKVIYTPGGDKTTMVALDAETGETVWMSPPLGDHYGYVSPLLINHNGKRQIIAMTGDNVIGVDPETGDIEWTFDDWGRRIGESIVTNTPLFSNGRLFFSNGYRQGSFMLELNNDATDVSLVWRNDDHGTHHGGFVLLDGVIYGSNWISNNRGNWVAVDWDTGETLYNESWNTKGSIITDGTMLYSYEERRGNVGLVKPNRRSFDVVSEFRVTGGEGPHWAHPVINDGILYIRHGPMLRAYSIRN
ncbi:MAG: alcohol dehydrogenase [Marinilabiliales bacterium]|nr:MAG: alcohol dehydrogenase [Marinilabiliales bacterium]